MLNKINSITSYDFEEIVSVNTRETPAMVSSESLIPPEHLKAVKQLSDAYHNLGLDSDLFNHRILRLFVENVSNGNYTIQHQF